MTISHSCCPQKRDIVAPVFVLVETLTLARGQLQVWDCTGCRAVIHVVLPEGDDTRLARMAEHLVTRQRLLQGIVPLDPQATATQCHRLDELAQLAAVLRS